MKIYLFGLGLLFLSFSCATSTKVEGGKKVQWSKNYGPSKVDVSKAIMKKEKVNIGEIRLADHDVPAGLYPDMTENGFQKDEWPSIFKKNHEGRHTRYGYSIMVGRKIIRSTEVN